MRKAAKGYTPAQTADMLEEDPALIRRISDAIEQTAPEHDMEKICELLAADLKELTERQLAGIPPRKLPGCLFVYLYLILGRSVHRFLTSHQCQKSCTAPFFVIL